MMNWLRAKLQNRRSWALALLVIRIYFSGELMDDLPWEFKPVQETVLAKPGESLQTVYWARNIPAGSPCPRNHQ